MREGGHRAWLGRGWVRVGGQEQGQGQIVQRAPGSRGRGGGRGQGRGVKEATGGAGGTGCVSGDRSRK